MKKKHVIISFTFSEAEALSDLVIYNYNRYTNRALRKIARAVKLERRKDENLLPML